VRNTRGLAIAAAVLVVVTLGSSSPAAADDLPPAPATSATPEPTPTPTAEPTPAPAPTTDALPADSDFPLHEGSTGARVKDAQERLAWLGYPIAPSELTEQRMGRSTVVAANRFQLKYGYQPSSVIGEGTWNMLQRKAGTIGRLPAACVGQTTLCIDKSQRLLRLVVNGTTRLVLDARFGFEGADTREGVFRVNRKSRQHVSSVYRTSMPFSLFFSGGQAVHYSAYFAREGYFGASHGCVNLRDYARTRWLYDHVPIGTRVYLYAS
jgi:hypothetical protein